MYKGKTVANSILEKQWEGFEDSPISPMKLQKLMFYLNGWHLATTGRGVVYGKFEVWQFGPVHEEVYHAFKRFGNRAITQMATVSSGGTKAAFVVSEDDESFHEILDLTMTKYMPFTALQLSAMTHAEGTPWYTALKNHRFTIDDELIRNYFIHLVRS